MFQAEFSAAGTDRSTLTYFCDFCKFFSPSDSTWFVCTEVSKGLSSNGSNRFCGWVGSCTTGERVSRILRHGREANGVALFEAFFLTAGEVEMFVDTMKLATDISDSILLDEEERVNCSGAEATCDMIDEIRNFINKRPREGADVDGGSLENGFQ